MALEQAIVGGSWTRMFMKMNKRHCVWRAIDNEDAGLCDEGSGQEVRVEVPQQPAVIKPDPRTD